MSTVFCISQHNIPPFSFASEIISPFYLEKRLSLIRAMPFPLKRSVQVKCDEDPAWKQHKRCMTILRVLLSLLPAFFFSQHNVYTTCATMCVFEKLFFRFRRILCEANIRYSRSVRELRSDRQDVKLQSDRRAAQCSRIICVQEWSSSVIIHLSEVIQICW